MPGGGFWRVNNSDRILYLLTQQFCMGRLTPPTGDRYRLVALLFGRPSSEILREQIMPDIAYWHYRSGSKSDFFMVGYRRNKFNPSAFARVVRQFEGQTTWKYSGETDLIILNALFDRTSNSAAFDFKTVIMFSLERALKEKVITSVPSFFEQVINYAESCNGRDPTWGFSDLQGQRIVGSWLLRLLLSLLPRNLRTHTQRAAQFVVKDISKNESGNKSKTR